MDCAHLNGDGDTVLSAVGCGAYQQSKLPTQVTPIVSGSLYIDSAARRLGQLR